MSRVLTDKIKNLLAKLGLSSGDVVFVHSGFGPVLKTFNADGQYSVAELLKSFHLALLETVGEEGTIAAPGFFYDYARKGKPFVLETSPPDRALGFYPMYLFKEEKCFRSLNPLASILAIGKHAEEICAHTSAYAYGITSPWARLVEHDATGLVIGLPFMMTFIHHVEALVGPPHIYNKVFRVPVIAGGKPINLPVVGAMRYLNYDINYKDDRLESLLKAKGMMKEAAVGELKASLTKWRDLQQVLTWELAKNSSYTLSAEPSFKEGELPDDGPRG